MTEVIICAATNLFRIYLIYRLIRMLVGETEPEKWKELLAYGGFFLINTGLYLTFHVTGINILSNIMGIFLIILLYTKSVKTNIFVTGIIYLINMGCDIITFSLFIEYNDGQDYNEFYSVITVFLIFICELIAEKIISCKKNADTIQKLFLITIPLCSIVMLIFVTYEKNRQGRELAVVSIGLLMINFLAVYFYNMLLKLYQQKYENEILQQKVRIYSNQLNLILEREAAVRTLRHDMKHHMNELKFLAAKNDSCAIKKYIDHMKEFIQNPDEIVSSGNTEIDSVLNYMLQIAKKKLISVQANVQLSEAVSHSFDTNVILGNLLENAIEAAEQTEEKLLNVNIQLKQGVLKIEIENSFHGKLLFQKKDGKQTPCLATTKEKKKQHGIGLHSVRKIVEKYNGIVEVDSQNSRFCVKVLLYMKEIEN